MFAHEYCGRLWWKLGWIILVPSIIIQIPFINSTEDTIGIVGGIICTIHMVVLMVAIFLTEMALKKNFNKDGSRKI
ncbi:MAG: SdpI family protein [Lachnospiraceae bacterium]|nr:SdpI family protein [Lachnospiraceae bacterium]